ncbi:MAG: tetratricopeptide repeat protein [Gammaproteobacteria bacterium]|nr:tetratricopeptide repeat protein [Gammaproteobacteria bacterium]
MFHRLALILCLLFTTTLVWAGKTEGPLKDLYFGEALFYAYQQDFFEAISRLDTELAQYYGLDEPQLNSLYYHIDHAEFSVGDFELFYRMHNRAGRAIKAVIEGNVEESVRNEALYRLAKMYYQKQQPLNALHTIERIKGPIPEKLINEEPYLRGQIYIANGKFTEAIALLQSIETQPELLGFSGYNLGIAQILGGEEIQGYLQLEKVGNTPGKGRNFLGMRDKANLVLGYRLLDAQQGEQAVKYLNRVRIKGPFSNKALLGSGWASAGQNKFDRALVPWTMLAKRNVTNASVQEALMAVPYAYGKLELFGRAAILYGKALEAYSKEIERLDASVKTIKKGKFLEAVVREELKKDKNWLVKLRDLPDTPETYYLMQMMASHDFQEALKNYFDLVELQSKLDTWEGNLSSFEEIIAVRKAYYEPMLPGMEAEFRSLDSKMKLRVEQRNSLDKRLKKMLIAPRPEVLINVEERTVLNILEQESIRLNKAGKLDANTKHRIDRLKGVIHWNVVTQYDDRFTKAHKNLRQLDQHVEKLTEIYESFVRTRQTATQSYRGYEKPLRHVSIKIRQAKGKVKTLLARQGNLIEAMAIKELETRRQRLEEYQVKARFALAESYDRAARKQTDEQLQKQIADEVEQQEAQKLNGQKESEKEDQNTTETMKDEKEDKKSDPNKPPLVGNTPSGAQVKEKGANNPIPQTGTE